MPVQVVLIDSAKPRSLACVSLIYLFIFFILVGVGVAGPKALQTYDLADVKLPCSSSPCTVSWSGGTSGLGPLNQVLALQVELARPMDSQGAQLPATNDVSFQLTYSLDITLPQSEGAVLVNNVTHSAAISCRKGHAACDAFLAFYQSDLSGGDLAIQLRMYDVLTPFGVSGGVYGLPLKLYATYVPATYTTFQLGWKYFFITASLLTFAMFSIMLCCGPGAKDEATGGCVPTSMEQRWVLALSVLLFFFNDPAFAAAIFNPTFGAIAFNGICTVTFIAVLLTYFLVHFHIAALQSEGGLRWELDQRRMQSLGALFWLPKAIFATAFWICSLSAYLWVRYQQESDPAYSLFEQMPIIGTYFFGFIYTVVAVYLLYLFALLVLACRYWKRMRAGNRLFITLTLLTLLLVCIGVYADLFTPLRTSSASFLVVYGAANLYIWALQIAYLPERRVTLADRIDEGASEIVDTRGVMAASGTEDLDVHLEDLELGITPDAAAAAAAASVGGASVPAGESSQRAGGASAKGAAPGGGRAHAPKAAAPEVSAGTVAAAPAAPASVGSAAASTPATAASDALADDGAAVAAAGGSGVFVVGDDDDEDGDLRAPASATAAAPAVAAAPAKPAAVDSAIDAVVEHE